MKSTKEGNNLLPHQIAQLVGRRTLSSEIRNHAWRALTKGVKIIQLSRLCWCCVSQATISSLTCSTPWTMSFPLCRSPAWCLARCSVLKGTCFKSWWLYSPHGGKLFKSLHGLPILLAVKCKVLPETIRSRPWLSLTLSSVMYVIIDFPPAIPSLFLEFSISSLLKAGAFILFADFLFLELYEGTFPNINSHKYLQMALP